MARKTMSRNDRSEKVPKKMQQVFDAVAELTDSFCRNHLNEEYAQLSRRLTAALCRKRPSPLSKGRTDVWACGIVYALGVVNFLFDKTQEPYMNATALCKGFGVGKSTASAKSTGILDALDIMRMDPRWCLQSRLERNPLAWFIRVNGFAVDARRAPQEIQEIAFQKGLIPYIPDDKERP